MKDCVHLRFWVKDPRIPINYDSESEIYSLELSDDLIIKPMYCNICGGHKRINAKSKLPPCRCGKPGRWARDSSLPVHYDPSLNVYELRMKHGQRLHLGFCPACGGQLPRIRIEDIASEPSKTDMEQIMEKVRPARTIEQLIDILGPPDEKHGPLKADPVDIQNYGVKDIKQSLEYNHLTPTANLHVTESEDGTLKYSFSGHQRKKPIFIHRIRTFYYQLMHYRERFNLVLWQYAPDTPVEKLLRHHKKCRWMVSLRMYSLITMMSTFVLAMAVGGFSKLDMIILLATTAICFLVIIPSFFAEALLYEIEDELKKDPTQYPVISRQKFICANGMVK